MKKNYQEPNVTNINENTQAGLPGALWGAALMVARAAAKVMKGGIDIAAGTDAPQTLQERRAKDDADALS